MEKKMDEKAIRKTFRKMRLGLGLSQIALGKSAGLSSDKLARWEKGSAKFSPEETEKLGKALDAAIIHRAESIPGPAANSDSKAFKRLRRAYGITQEALARSAGLSQTDISLYENGYGSLDAKEVARVEKAIEDLTKGAIKGMSLSERVPLSTLMAPLSSLAYSVDPVKKERDELREEVVRLKELIASHKKIEELSGEIQANNKEVIEELKAEIARLELLNRDNGESKDREIQALREQLKKLQNDAVTVPKEK